MCPTIGQEILLAFQASGFLTGIVLLRCNIGWDGVPSLA